MRCIVLLWRDVDQACAQHTVDDFGNLELGQHQPLGDLVQVPFAVDDRENFPLARLQGDE
jgi:hypothetical protein